MTKKPTQPALISTYYIDSDHPKIQEQAHRLTGELTDPKEKAIRLFDWTRDHIRYHAFSPMVMMEDYKASTILERGFGFCIHKATVLAALCRAADIPCRLGFANLINHRMPEDMLAILKTETIFFHGFNLIFLNNEWLKATCTFDRQQCEKSNMTCVTFDGKHSAPLPATTPDGSPHFDYTKSLGVFDDLPYEQITTALKEGYGATNPMIKTMWEQALNK